MRVGRILGERGRLGRRDRAGDAPLDAWAAQSGDGPLAVREAEERPHRRQFARGRCVGEAALAAPPSQIGAQVRRLNRGQHRGTDRLAAVPAEEGDEPVGRREIGADGMFGAPTVAAQMLGAGDGGRRAG